MPRAARKKEPTAIYHAMSRSITEFDLFPDNSDKESFLDILQKYIEKFHCKIYAYCLMTNHYHMIVDTCGYDISKLMKSINQTYVKHINRKYNRRGHLLTERFKIENTDEIMHRWKRNTMDFRRAVAYALTTFCGMGNKEACKHMKNISPACLAELSQRGYAAININNGLKEILLTK